VTVLALGAVLAVTMTACLPVPLGDPAASRIDPALAGWWLHEDATVKTVAVIYPHDERTYVVHSVGYEQKDGGVSRKSQALCKAWLTDVKGRSFLTLEPLAQRLPGETGGKVYPVFRLSRDGGPDALGARGVRESFPALKAAKTPADVAAAIARDVDHADLYGEEARFRRLDPARDAETIAALSKLFE
jgi:hypothetical protein